MSTVPGRAARLRSLVLPGFASLLVLGILAGLGTWQLERRSWKHALIAGIEARAYGEPARLPPASRWPDWKTAPGEYARVRLEGTFRHADEALVHGLMEAGRGRPVQGFYVLTPLTLDEGGTVIVNRGFVPTELRDPPSRADGQVSGRVSVTGLLRAPETRTLFVPENEPGRGAWFTRDVGAIAAARGLERVAPFLVDADATPNPGGWPRGGQTRLVLADNHLQYALTWFGLAGTLLAVFAAFAARRLASEPDPKLPPSPS